MSGSFAAGPLGIMPGEGGLSLGTRGPTVHKVPWSSRLEIWWILPRNGASSLGSQGCLRPLNHQDPQGPPKDTFNHDDHVQHEKTQYENVIHFSIKCIVMEIGGRISGGSYPGTVPLPWVAKVA